MWRVAGFAVFLLGGVAVALAQDAPAPKVIGASKVLVTPLLHPSFETALVPAAPRLTSHTSGIRSEAAGGGRVVVHRWVRSGNLYSGYDLILEPQPADPDTQEQRMQVSFAPLSVAAEALFGAPARLVAPSGYPAARVMKTRDALTVDPLLSPPGGQRIVDQVTMTLSPAVVVPTPEEQRARRIEAHVGLTQTGFDESAQLLRLLRQVARPGRE